MGADHLHDHRMRDTNPIAKHNACHDCDPNAKRNADARCMRHGQPPLKHDDYYHP